MPEFETVSLQEAQLRTIPGRQGRSINQYIDYIRQMPEGQAGKLRVLEQEKSATIRRRLVAAAQALGVTLVIKRSKEDIYFWRADREKEQPRPRRPRRGRAGGLLPPDIPVSEPPRVEPGVIEEESPELDQLASEAERRVEQG